jgi:hypothetical protein
MPATAPSTVGTPEQKKPFVMVLGTLSLDPMGAIARRIGQRLRGMGIAADIGLLTEQLDIIAAIAEDAPKEEEFKEYRPMCLVLIDNIAQLDEVLTMPHIVVDPLMPILIMLIEGSGRSPIFLNESDSDATIKAAIQTAMTVDEFQVE